MKKLSDTESQEEQPAKEWHILNNDVLGARDRTYVRLARLALKQDQEAYIQFIRESFRRGINKRVLLVAFIAFRLGGINQLTDENYFNELLRYAECLEGIEKDFQRGIVRIDENGGVDQHKARFQPGQTEGLSWKMIQDRLLHNEGELLKKVSAMQGKGMLIGVDENEKFIFRDRGAEPVIYAFKINDERQRELITITTDMPQAERKALIKQIRDNENWQFANYWEILKVVLDSGYELPPDPKESGVEAKKGIVAASEVVTGEDFVCSSSRREWRNAMCECGDVSRDASVRVVFFHPNAGSAYIYDDAPSIRFDYRGAIRVLRG